MGPVVIGVDGGGTYTRALCVGAEGRPLGYAETGGAHPGKNANAAENVRSAITRALEAAGRLPHEVVAVVAGIAGYDDPEKDRVWAESFVAVPGLPDNCVRRVVNDAVVAHAGAFGPCAPGVMVIAGTGSIVLGRTPGGEWIRNYDFRHSSRATARNLGYAAVWVLLSGEGQAQDMDFKREVLAYWQAADLAALCRIAAKTAAGDSREAMRRYGDLAPQVTRAATAGAPLAIRVCEEAAGELAQAVLLVGACFAAEGAGERPVSVALLGGVARDGFMSQAFWRYLEKERRSEIQPRYVPATEPAFSAAAGAALLALEAIGGATDAPDLRERLARHPAAIII